MAEAITVARPYAEAVFRLALESKDLSQWSKILQIAAEIAQDDQIKLLVGNPLVSAVQLSELILEIGGKKFTQEARNFIKLMVENKRIHVMPQVMELFEQLKAVHRGGRGGHRGRQNPHSIPARGHPRIDGPVTHQRFSPCPLRPLR